MVSRSVYDDNPNNVQREKFCRPIARRPKADAQVPVARPTMAPTRSSGTTTFMTVALASLQKSISTKCFPFGFVINRLEVPNNSQHGNGGQMVTSFSSKSELALNLSTDGQSPTFSGYVAPIDQLDVSNFNTPGAVDPTNPVGENVYRAEAQVDPYGQFQFTETNAYSGNNGRAVIWNNSHGADFIYTSGNAGKRQQSSTRRHHPRSGNSDHQSANEPESAQNPSASTPVGSFNITELRYKADKIGKDDNFRGLTIFNNVLYYSISIKEAEAMASTPSTFSTRPARRVRMALACLRLRLLCPPRHPSTI